MENDESLEGIIEGEDNLKRYIAKYYKDLFSSPERSNSSLIESRIHDIAQVCDIENELLTNVFF